MAIQLNPFHVNFDHAKRRTLAEIETATNGFDISRGQSVRALPARPRPAQPIQSGVSTKVKSWLSNNFKNLDGSNNFRSSQRNPILILDDDEEPPSQHAVAGPLTDTPSRKVTTRPPSRHSAANRLKRKASQRDDHVEDVIFVRGSVYLGPNSRLEHAPGASGANTVEASALPKSVESVARFFTLATEIREKIYRHLLVSSKPIYVQNLWTEMARRPSRRGARRGQNGPDAEVTIETHILSVCRRTALEGTRILYSENSFLYQLRDPEVLDKKTAGTQKPTTRSQTKQYIDLAKYGHLIRHMAIELEPNRKGAQYQELMAAALQALVSQSSGATSPRTRPSFLMPCGSIHLHTLTITVSPLLATNRRGMRSAAGDQDISKDGRSLSVVGLFSRGAAVLKALQRININFLRINVHVNSNVKSGSQDGLASDEEDAESDSEPEGTPRSSKQLQPRHLETTLDLRYLPRHMEGLRLEPLGELWENDMLMQEQRRKRGAEAEEKLSTLRKKIEGACLDPEEELCRGFWQEHGVAEWQRRERRARHEAKFDGEENGAEAGDGRGLRGMKSLIISIARVGDELRAYRP
ncbi:hypothetical protein BT67DRAFT_453271 [Trichocladium antarcticum]|uniref:Uncharacterized protein n=1 Tax=Trichocladium antarcticum TaxID=1450529 RepID=A0AAN6UU73_9PEZI|nr:hypothetical protein BT67DRAFT_453271 [Trichocladium antarcticum]